MKDVTRTLLDRRSIRRYERQSITDAQLELIYRAIRNTPTSYNGQQFSVIDIDDQSLKEKIYELTSQKQIKTCSHFLLFIADYHKISLAAERADIDMPPFYNTADGLIVGVVDAALALMGALTMAEALGLGTCPIGYARTVAPDKLSELLGLPQRTFIVCGLAIGVPRELPDFKPKQPIDLLIHKNTYPADNDKTAEELQRYDETIKEYNRTREGYKTDNDWASHIIGYYREAMNCHLLEALRRRGFDITE